MWLLSTWTCEEKHMPAGWAEHSTDKSMFEFYCTLQWVQRTKPGDNDKDQPTSKHNTFVRESFHRKQLTSTFKDEHPLKNSLMLVKQSASVLGSWQYWAHTHTHTRNKYIKTHRFGNAEQDRHLSDAIISRLGPTLTSFQLSLKTSKVKYGK